MFPVQHHRRRTEMLFLYQHLLTVVHIRFSHIYISTTKASDFLFFSFAFFSFSNKVYSELTRTFSGKNIPFANSPEMFLITIRHHQYVVFNASIGYTISDT